MIRKALIFSLLVSLLAACQNEDGVSIDPTDQVQVISADALPETSQTFIDENFSGEVVTDAFKISSSEGEVTYEAFLTNNSNLVFESDGDLLGFGDSYSSVEFDGSEFRGRGRGPKGRRPNFDATPIEIADLPASVTDYISANYPENEVIKALSVTKDDESTEIHVLVKEVGALIFDADGNFIELHERGDRRCGNFEELALEELSAVITDYITANYPDNEMIKARQGTREDGGDVEIHVLVKEVGVLVFDADGNFVELIERKRGRHRGE